MGWEYKNQYLKTLINTVFTSPNLTATAEWEENMASFEFDVLPLVPAGATLPNGTVAQIRGRRYNTFLQGIHEGRVFWEYYGSFGTTLVVAPVEICELVASLREGFEKGDYSEPAFLRVIAPTDRTVRLASTRLGYKP